MCFETSTFRLRNNEYSRSNIVGRKFASSGQHIATLLNATCCALCDVLRRVATCWVLKIELKRLNRCNVVWTCCMNYNVVQHKCCITGSPHIRFRIWMKDQITFIARVLWVLIRARGKLRGLLVGGLEPRSRKSGTRKFLGGSDRATSVFRNLGSRPRTSRPRACIKNSK